jgi:ribulose-5-phosphate 4-epimerase/fuculose-1-phosphate aldolase
MSYVSEVGTPSVRNEVSEAEWQTRLELAACYRLVARHGMTDQTATHISARVADEPDAMLLNPWGLFFDEITASSLVKVKLDGSDLEAAKSINKAGFTVHSAVLGARDDVVCALHTHTRAGMAVSAMADGLLPLSQHALRFYNRLAYHDYEGIATDLDERQRLVADLGGHYAMILRNHGLLGCGRSVAEAFSVVFYLEKSCHGNWMPRSRITGGSRRDPVDGAETAKHALQLNCIDLKRRGSRARPFPQKGARRSRDRVLPFHG